MLGKQIFYLFLLLVLISYSCKQNKENQPLKFNFRPNILWICCEDISPDLGCYGNDIVSTPNIDKLASEGILFKNAYTTAGVCAPSRSSIITGIYPTGLGTNAMRNREIEASTFVKGFVHYIREKGYYCVNNNKEDYNLGNRLDIWHESSSTAHWEKRPQGKPFFVVFDDVITHEHKIWAKPWDFEFIRSNEVNVPPYYPNAKVVRHDIARNYSNIMELDAHVGFFIKELEDQNLLDSTIIVFYSDHGGPLPRQKREIYDSGIKVPLIIRFPNLYKKGKKISKWLV